MGWFSKGLEINRKTITILDHEEEILEEYDKAIKKGVIAWGVKLEDLIKRIHSEVESLEKDLKDDKIDNKRIQQIESDLEKIQKVIDSVIINSIKNEEGVIYHLIDLSKEVRSKLEDAKKSLEKRK